MSSKTKTCTKCGAQGPIDSLFGWFKAQRWKGGKHTVLKPQSRCYWCRGRKQARADAKKIDEFVNSKTFRENVRATYIEMFPNDKNNTKRAMNFMLDKIERKTNATRQP